MDLFEGYIGAQFRNNQAVDDLLFFLLLLFLVFFAVQYYTNTSAFLKMLKNITYTKERQSPFEKGITDRLFRFFSIFQMASLSGMLIFTWIYSNGFLGMDLTIRQVLICISSFIIILLLFYFLKKGMYRLTATVFSETTKYKMWDASYQAIMGGWGIFLYFPVMWIILWRKYLIIPFLLAVVSFLFCRFLIIYKTMRIFHTKKDSLLYISLYLCGQEILPLVFLYEGMFYLYNFIKTSTLWH